jgi:hypothetical protein
MKCAISILLITLFSAIGCKFNIKQTIVKKEPKNNIDTTYKKFKLEYLYSGLGFNMGSMQPHFIVKGTTFLYLYSQNSNNYLNSQARLKSDTIQTGEIRYSSIDSIISLITELKDSNVYISNPHIMSGGVHTLHIRSNHNEVNFALHNSYHPLAQKIIKTLNPYIFKNDKKLWLFYEK